MHEASPAMHCEKSPFTTLAGITSAGHELSTSHVGTAFTGARSFRGGVAGLFAAGPPAQPKQNAKPTTARINMPLGTTMGATQPPTVLFACNQRQRQVSIRMFDAIKHRWNLIGASVLAAILLLVLAAGRDKTQAILSTPAEPAEPAPDDDAMREVSAEIPSCQVFQGAALQAEPRFFPANYLMLGDIEVLTQAPPLRWLRHSDNRIFELRGNLPVDLGVGPSPKYHDVRWDDNAWYSHACFEFCDRRDSVGAPMSQIRIDRRSGRVTRLSPGDPVVTARLLHHEYIYWASSNGCAIGEGLMRVAITGGRPHRLGLDNDFIHGLRAYPEGILVAAASTIGWIANGTSTISPVMTRDAHQHRHARDQRDHRDHRDHRFRSAIFDGHGFYITEQIGTQADTTIFFVDLATRKVRIVLESQDTITQLAVHGDSLYFTTHRSADIHVVATDGGTPRVAVAEPSHICATVSGLWATDAGLVWTRHEDNFPGTALYLAAWPELHRAI